MGKERMSDSKGKIVADMLLKIANGLFLISFLLIDIQIVIHTNEFVPESLPQYMLCGVFVIVFLVGAYKLSDFLSKNAAGSLVCLILLVLFQVAYVLSVFSVVSADAYVVNFIAYHYSAGTLAQESLFYPEYLSIYPNNIPIVKMLVGLYRIVKPSCLENTWLLLSFLSSVLADIAVCFIYKLSKELLGKRWAVFAVLMSFPLIILSEPATIFYTDILSLWTVPCGMYCLWKSNGKIREGVLSGFVIAFGIMTKPQIVVIVIAYGIVMALSIGQTRTVRHARKGLAFLISVLVMSAILSNVSHGLGDVVTEEQIESHKMPVEHFIALGLNESSYGQYNREDIADTMALQGQAAKKSMLRNKIQSRLEHMGGVGVVQHIGKKIDYGMGNGTFTNGRRTWRGKLINKGETAQMIQNYFVTELPGWTHITAPMLQVLYIFLMIAMTKSAIPTLWRRRKMCEDHLILFTDFVRMAMIGMVLFLLLLECNNRYFIALIPLYIVLFTYGVKEDAQWLKKPENII